MTTSCDTWGAQSTFFPPTSLTFKTELTGRIKTGTAWKSTTIGTEYEYTHAHEHNANNIDDIAELAVPLRSMCYVCACEYVSEVYFLQVRNLLEFSSNLRLAVNHYQKSARQNVALLQERIALWAGAHC